MNSEDKFKESLKSLLESKEFPFEEKDWDKAAAYISKERAGSKWRRLGLLVLALGGTLSLFFVARDQAPANEARIVAAAPHVPSPAPAKHNLTEPSAVPEKAAQAPLPVVTPVSEMKSEPLVLADAQPETPADKTERKATKAEPAVVSQEPVKREGSADVSLTINKVAKEETKEPEAENPGQSVTRTEQTVERVIENPVSANKKTEQDEDILSTSVVTTPSSEVVVQPTLEPAPEPAVEQEKKETAAVTPTLPPSVTATAEKPVPDSIKAKVPRQMLFSCELGSSFTTGWKNTSGRDARGFNPIAGINYMSPIDSRFTLSFGIQYQRTGHLSEFSHTSKNSRLSFGEESEVLVITPSKLHYLAVPLRLYYSLDEKNTFGAGYTIAYLLDVESSVESYTLKVGKQSNNKTYTTRGYTDGFGLFDSQLSFFYRRHLYKNFSLHGEAFLGLNDVKENGFFGDNARQRTTGFKLMLVYAIFDRNK